MRLPPCHRRHWFCLLGAQLLLRDLHAVEPPALMLAKVYRPGINLRDFWVSEKLDGVRGRWDGRQLITRGGLVVQAPDWFTAGWPDVPLDGELWAGRRRFEDAVSTVRRQQPEDQAWRQIRFMVFDLPAHPGVFTDRLQAGMALANKLQHPGLQVVPQELGSTPAALMQRLHALALEGAEGLMLHRGDAHYKTQRSDDLLKLKEHEEADARVTGYEPGRGRHAGRVGALQVQTEEGLRFRIGSGLSDALRERPPAIGSWVTYRYRGLHDSGLPRFATLLRVRADADLSGLR